VGVSRELARAEHGARPHLTPRTPAYPFQALAHIALRIRMESTASHAHTLVAHDSHHPALQPTASPLEKGKSRMVLDSPASGTTMAADLRDLSRARPPPAPSLSMLSPLRAAMQQLDYRGAQVGEITDRLYLPLLQPTTTELQLHQEFPQLAHQLQHTQLHIPAVIYQQVQATTAPQTAHLNVLAEGLQQGHLIAQNAQAAVANALTAPLQDTAQSASGPALPRAPAPAFADMSMDHDAYNDDLGNPVNPRLPVHWRGRPRFAITSSASIVPSTSDSCRAARPLDGDSFSRSCHEVLVCRMCRSAEPRNQRSSPPR